MVQGQPAPYRVCSHINIVQHLNVWEGGKYNINLIIPPGNSPVRNSATCRGHFVGTPTQPPNLKPVSHSESESVTLHPGRTQLPEPHTNQRFIIKKQYSNQGIDKIWSMDPIHQRQRKRRKERQARSYLKPFCFALKKNLIKTCLGLGGSKINCCKATMINPRFQPSFGIACIIILLPRARGQEI